jgi:protein phosphatase
MEGTMATNSLPFVQAFGMTDRGRVRTSNQDHFLIAEMARTMWVLQSSLTKQDARHGSHHAHVFVVADGMGGHKGGDVASAIAVESLEHFLLDVLHRFSNLRKFEDESVAQDFHSALQEAQAKIMKEAEHNPTLKGMGTTLTMAFSSDWNLYVVHVGDSRCYLYRAGAMQQLTTDHTVAAELVRRGALLPEQAAHSRFRHVMTNTVGGNSTRLLIEFRKLELLPQDLLLLCSDGLTNMLSDARIAAVLQAETDLQRACERLLAEANNEGGRDNITAVAARFAATS